MHGTITRPDPAPRRVPLTLRLALRELRAGLSGFAVFLACIALGVTAIAGVASISRSLSDGLGREGRRILGGDLAYNLINREATDDGAAGAWHGKAGSTWSTPCAPWRRRAAAMPPWSS